MKAEMLAQTQKRGRGLGDGGGNGPVAQLFHGYIYGSPLSSSNWSKTGKHGKKDQEPPERKKKRK